MIDRFPTIELSQVTGALRPVTENLFWTGYGLTLAGAYLAADAYCFAQRKHPPVPGWCGVPPERKK